MAQIARKPAVDDLGEEPQDPLQTTIELQTDGNTGEGKHDSSAGNRINTDGTVPTTEQPCAAEAATDEDPNLFEEEKRLNLIDRDDGDADQVSQHVRELGQSGQEILQDNTATAASAQDRNLPPSILISEDKQISKKKGKRKPTAPRRDPSKPVIIILDSLSQPHANATRALREWLQAEGLEKRGMTVEIDNKGYYPKSAQIPMQNNFSDCGLYVLGYAEKFFKDPDRFRKKLLDGEMSAEKDWPDMHPVKMRNNLRELIFRLYTEQVEARHKAKKAARTKVTPTSPAKTESKKSSPASLRPSVVETDPSTILQAAADAESSSVAATDKVVTPQTTTSLLRPPFAPEAPANKRHSHTVEDVQQNTTSRPLPPAGSSEISFTKTTPAPPEQSPSKRRGSPEVRIPAKSPNADPSSHVRYDGATDRSCRPTQQLTDLTSPLQNHGLCSKDNEKLRMPTASKVHNNSPSRPPGERLMPSSPLETRTRSGSHDDPITFDDSQDLDAPFQQQLQPTRKLPPEVIELDRSQESVDTPTQRAKATSQSSPTQRKPNRQAIQHENSVQEGVGYEWQEGHDVTRALRLSLDDAQARLNQRQSSPRRELNRPMEDVYDAWGAYSQSSHTVQEVPETQAIDVDDEEVPETPKQQRSSLGPDVGEMDWQYMPACSGR